MKSIKKMLSRIRYGKPVVLVSGLPRSGTSMLMQMLDRGGVPVVTDTIRKADEDNPKGYYELEQVKDLDKGGDKSWLEAYKGQAVKIISFLLRDLPANLNYKVLFILRDIDEIIESQKKMLDRRGEDPDGTSDEKMKSNYENHLWRVRYQLNHSSNMDALYIQHRDILNQPEIEAKRIHAFLGDSLDIEAMTSVVDKSLYRNRR